jgi:hypothetical protein
MTGVSVRQNIERQRAILNQLPLCSHLQKGIPMELTVHIPGNILPVDRGKRFAERAMCCAIE